MDDASSSATPKPRILIVEDEATTRKAITQALNLMDYRADGVASGSEALDRLSSAPYDLMLLDLRMPEIDGVEVMKRARTAHSSLLVIVLTAHATLESAIAAVRSGAADYLLKPCSIREIEAAISRALRYHQKRLGKRQHLIRVMTEALEALQVEEIPDSFVPPGRSERFLKCGPVSLDRERRLVVVARDGSANFDAELTENEAALLAHLMQQADTVLSCRKLAQGALGYEVSEREAEEIVRPHISRLRKKVEPDPAHPRLIRTIRGKGYLFSTP
jgi:DNA-binding response OmpR family regulator